MEHLINGWYLQQGNHFRYNAGIVAFDGGSVLIDPGMTFREIEDIRYFLMEQGLPCNAVILTHFHWDHILGTGKFAKAAIHAHQSFPTEQENHQLASVSAIIKWAEETGEMPLNVENFPIPAELHSENNITSFGTRDLRLLHTPGHTADHLSIFDDNCGVLWAGDILSSHEIPLVSSSLAAYIHTLESIKGLSLEMIVPGHGMPAYNSTEVQYRITEDLNNIFELRNRVGEAVNSGLGMNEVIDSCGDMPIRYPQENAVAHTWNIESIFVELGGEAGTEPVGWQKEWEDGE